VAASLPRTSPTRMNESTTRLDDAARAGWLYYIAGKTQDDIARAMNISRPSAQRLVSLCRTDGLLSFRLNHPISAWMGLAARLTERFALTHCDVVPTAADARATASAVSEAAAIVIERVLRKDEPAIIAVGTGRSLRASVTRVTPMSRPHHRLVSLAGNISPDGSASPYNALETLAGLTGAPAFPLPLPMHAADAAQRDLLLRIGCVQRIFAMAAAADVWFSGLSQFDPEAALFRDGFLNRDELLDVMRAGAVGATLAHLRGARPAQGAGAARRAQGAARQRPRHRRGDGARAAGRGGERPAWHGRHAAPDPLRNRKHPMKRVIQISDTHLSAGKRHFAANWAPLRD